MCPPLSYTIPILGGIVADTKWGRFKTICVGTAVGAFAHILLVVPGLFNQRQCCGIFLATGSEADELPGLFLSFSCQPFPLSSLSLIHPSGSLSSPSSSSPSPLDSSNPASVLCSATSHRSASQLSTLSSLANVSSWTPRLPLHDTSRCSIGPSTWALSFLWPPLTPSKSRYRMAFHKARAGGWS